jgi:hypothetical protein
MNGEEAPREGHDAMHTADGDSKDDDKDDHVRLIKRLRTLKQVIEPVRLETIPPPLAKDKRSVKAAKLISHFISLSTSSVGR